MITIHVHCQSQCSTLVQKFCHLPCLRSGQAYCVQTDCLVLLAQETRQMSSVRFHSSIHTAMDLNLDFFVWCLHYLRWSTSQYRCFYTLSGLLRLYFTLFNNCTIAI